MLVDIDLVFSKIPFEICVRLLIKVSLSMKVPTTLVKALTAAFFAASSRLVPIPLEITVFISNPSEKGPRIFLVFRRLFYHYLCLKASLWILPLQTLHNLQDCLGL